MTAEILQRMDDRKKVKHDKDQYEVVDKEIKQMCKEATELYFNTKCDEIEKQFV